MSESVSRLIADIERLEAFPAVAIHILELSLGDPDPAELAAQVERDIGLTAKVLRLANSALCGLAVPAESIAAATHVLGPKRLASLAMTTGAHCFFMGYGESTPRSNKSLWEESYHTALFARAIAQRVLRPDEIDLAYTVGLLQNMGHVILDRFLVSKMDEILVLRDEGVDPLMAERHVLGMDHARCAQLLGRKWGLPPSLQSGILYHHAPAAAESLRRLCEVVNVAEFLTFERIAERTTSLTLPASPDAAQLLLRIANDVELLVDEVRQIAEESAFCWA